MLTFTIDHRHNVAYLRLSEPQGQVRTVCVDDDLNVDLSEHGQVCGIEYLNPVVPLDRQYAYGTQASGARRRRP